MVTFDCPKCGHAYQVPENYMGKKVRCKKCSEIFSIPSNSVSEQQTSMPNNSSTDVHLDNSSPEESCLSKLPNNKNKNDKLLTIIISSVATLFIIAFAIGYPVYNSHKNKKIRDSQIEEILYLIDDASVKSSMIFGEGVMDVQYVGMEDAIKMYEQAINLIDEHGLNSYFEDELKTIQNEIQSLKQKIQITNLIPNLSESQIKADKQFQEGMFSEASKIYEEIVTTIAQYKEKDGYLSIPKKLISHCEDGINICHALEAILLYGRNGDVTPMLGYMIVRDKDYNYTKVFNYLDSMENPSPKIREVVAVMQKIQKASNDYVTLKENEQLLAQLKEEENKLTEKLAHLKEQKRQHDLAEAEKQRQYELAQAEQQQQLASQQRQAKRATGRELADKVVSFIINRSNTFRNASYTGSQNRGSEMSYNYDVEYVVGNGSLKVGTFNVAIQNGKCREVYFNGKELWTQVIDPKLAGYKNPPD